MIKQHEILIEPIAKEMFKLSKLAEKNSARAYKYIEEIDEGLLTEEKGSPLYDTGCDYRTKRKYSESIKAFKEAIKLDHFYSCFLDIAITYMWMKQFKRALYYCEKALDMVIRYNCRKVLKKHQRLYKSNRLTRLDLAELILDVKKTILSDSTYGSVCCCMATCYEKMGEPKKAEKFEEESKRISELVFKPFEHLWAKKGASS